MTLGIQNEASAKKKDKRQRSACHMLLQNCLQGMQASVDKEVKMDTASFRFHSIDFASVRYRNGALTKVECTDISNFFGLYALTPAQKRTSMYLC